MGCTLLYREKCMAFSVVFFLVYHDFDHSSSNHILRVWYALLALYMYSHNKCDVKVVVFGWFFIYMET